MGHKGEAIAFPSVHLLRTTMLVRKRPNDLANDKQRGAEDDKPKVISVGGCRRPTHVVVDRTGVHVWDAARDL